MADFDFREPFGLTISGQQEEQEFLTAMNQTTIDVIESSSTDLSDGQEIILVVLQICSALLSLMGSSTIVYKIARSLYKKQKTTPYDRIILGLSSCDIAASITYAIGPFMLPSETSKRVFAMGNDFTCGVLGLLMQLPCIWAIWYNCMLSYYYLLTVRFQVKRNEFRRKYELWMHLSGAIFFPLTAVIGFFGDWYSEMDLVMACWIHEIPKGCYETGDCISIAIAYVYAAVPTIITLFSLVINNIIIYVFVRKVLLSSVSSSTRTHDVEESTNESTVSAEHQSVQKRLTRETAIQCFLYVSTFLVTFLPSFAVSVLESVLPLGEENPNRLFPLLVLQAMLLPLQGFLNVFIYLRPTYVRFRTASPEESVWFIMKHALFDPNIPKLQSSANTSSRGGGPRRQKDSLDPTEEKQDEASHQESQTSIIIS